MATDHVESWLSEVQTTFVTGTIAYDTDLLTLIAASKALACSNFFKHLS